MKRKLLIIFLLLLVLIYFDKIYFFVVKQFYPLKYEKSIVFYSRQWRVDPILICAMIKAESNFKKEVVSSKGAIGLMQLTPNTAKWVCQKININYQYQKLFDPEINILIGSWYIKYLIDYYDNDEKLAIAAYNAGMTNVDRWVRKSNKLTIEIDEIPFRETSAFVKRVLRNYEIYKKLYGPRLKSGF